MKEKMGEIWQPDFISQIPCSNFEGMICRGALFGLDLKEQRFSEWGYIFQYDNGPVHCTKPTVEYTRSQHNIIFLALN